MIIIKKEIHPQNLTGIPKITIFEREMQFKNHHFWIFLVSILNFGCVQPANRRHLDIIPIGSSSGEAGVVVRDPRTFNEVVYILTLPPKHFGGLEKNC